MKIWSREEINDTLDKASKPVQWIWGRLPEAVLGMLSLILIVFCILTFLPGVGKMASKLVTGNQYVTLIDGMLNPFRNRKALLESGLPIYDLKIKRGEYAVLEKVAREAIKKGWMSDDLKVWANAQFFHQGVKYNVKVRLRGDLPNHWEDPKKSWRIKFGKQMIEYGAQVSKERIFFEGKKQINLIIPQDRRHILAYFVNQLMREYGLASPRDKFVVLRINGVLQGLYYEVEHLDKPLLASYKRPETTIFGQNDRVMHFDKYTKLGIPTTADARFDLGSMRRSIDTDGRLAMCAMQVLIDHSLNPGKENFKRVREVLDWKKYLYYRNLTTLCNTNHVRFGSDNFRLYYDPSRGLLEPIPWDVHLEKLPREPGTIDFWNSHGPDELQIATLSDPQLRLQRNRLMWEWVFDEGEQLMTRFNKIYETMRPLFWVDVLSTPNQVYKLDVLKNTLAYNLKRVHKVLSNSNVNFTYKLEAPGRAALEITTLNFSGIYLQNIQIKDSLFEGTYRLYEDSNNNGELDAEDRLLRKTAPEDLTVNFAFEKYILPDVYYGHDYIEGRYWEFFDTLSGRYRLFLVGKLTPEYKDPLVWNPPTIKVEAQNAVTGYNIPSAFLSQQETSPPNSIAIVAYDASAPFDLEAPNDSLEAFLSKHREFAASKTYPGAVELSGKRTLSGTVIVPKKISLLLTPGTDLTMKPNANILCYGGFQAVGTPEMPIKIHGDGSTHPWGVLGIIRPPQKVVMKHTEIQHAGQGHINGILFTGGFAVHEGDLELEHCRFMNMKSEDGTNLKNGRIMMSNCLFSGNASDAIDIDFGTGEVRDCQFVNIGGDGVDLSGSEILVTGCLFENMVDKGISVGENSHPLIVNNLFYGNDIGISTKDLSHARVANCTFASNRLAIEAKRKKPMFGGGSGEFVNCVFSGNTILLKEDYFSQNQVTVMTSFADNASQWQPTETVAIQTISFDHKNYRLPVTFSMDDKAQLTFPEWLPKEINHSRIKYPGIYTDIITEKQKSASARIKGMK